MSLSVKPHIRLIVLNHFRKTGLIFHFHFLFGLLCQKVKRLPAALRHSAKLTKEKGARQIVPDRGRQGNYWLRKSNRHTVHHLQRCTCYNLQLTRQCNQDIGLCDTKELACHWFGLLYFFAWLCFLFTTTPSFELRPSMEGAAAEVSPEPAGRGLKSILTKARRGEKDPSSRTSIDGTDNSSETHGVRSSIDSVRGRIRASRESSIDGGTTTTIKSRTLSKLIPARIKKKLKKPEERDEQEEGKGGEAEERTGEQGQDDGRGRRITDQPATSSASAPASADPHSPIERRAGSESQSTLGGSSLIPSDDSETES